MKKPLKKTKSRKSKSQLSLELLVFLAAYLAFLGVLISASHESFSKTLPNAQSASAKQQLQSACFFIDFFSLDGAHAVFGKTNFQGFSSSGGKALFFENNSAECNARFRFENGLKVELAKTEAK